MKTAKVKSKGLMPVSCKCELNLKAGEIGLKLSLKKKGKGIQHYTAKGKEKYAEYFLASLVKTFADLMDIKDIDLVKYQYEESNMLKIGAKEDQDISNSEAQTRDMLAIQKVINEAASEGVQEYKSLENEKRD